MLRITDAYKRFTGWLLRFTDRHRLVTVVVVATLISGPAYIRQEAAINKAQEAATSAQEALALVVAQRDVARKISCDDTLDFIRQINAGFTAALIGPGQTRSPQELAQAQAFLDLLLIPERDCSTAGIKEFYDADETQVGG